MLFVESAPGRLKDLYEFDDEEDRIRAAVNATGVREGHMEILNTPQLSELSGHARRRKWEAIHVSGVDTQQAGWFLEGFYNDLREHHPDRLQGVVDSSTDSAMECCCAKAARSRNRSVSATSPMRW